MPITAFEIEEPTRSPQQEPVIVTFAVNDPEVLQALSEFPEGPARTDFMVIAMKVGVLSLKLARGSLDTEGMRREGERIMGALTERLSSWRELLGEEVANTLAHYFDPQSGSFTDRMHRLTRADGELAMVMQHQVQAGESRLKELFERFIGENSQILKLLDPSQENHLVKALESALAGAVIEQNQAILSQFSLDNKESALVRFLGELSTRHGDLNQALAQNMQAVVSEFSLDKEDSALSRLVERVERSQRNVASELTLDNEKSALSRMYRMLEDHQQNVTRSHDALAAKLDAAVQVLQAKREEAAKGTRHGVEFEAALAAHLRPLVGSGGDTLYEVGATTGVISHCKVGDHVIVLGADKVAAGAKIVIEAKENASYDLRKTLEEADLARRNRQADLCIFVHSTKTAGTSIPHFQRLGKDIVVQWTADDESRDMWLQAAIMAAQAICTQINSHDKDEAASFDKIDHAIERIRRDIDGFEEINTSANTARSAAERILSRARRMKDSLEAQTDSIWEEFLKIKRGAQRS